MAKKPRIKDEFKDIFADLAAMNPDASILSKSPLSIVKNWIDTGCYALNAIMSGSVWGGVPQGRITGFAGPNSAGKTLIMLKTLAHAQKTLDMFGVIFDSEVAVEPGMAENVGCDLSRIQHLPVETVEDCRNQICKFLDNVIKQDKKGRFFLIIDSLGNLASAKEIADAEKGKNASDMGLRAKAIKSMMRTLTYKCAKAEVPLLFSAHIYDDPTSLYPMLVKPQSGGKGPAYLASLMVQLAHKSEKQEKEHEHEQIIAGAERVGATLNALTIKNRFVPPFLRTDMYVNYKTGLDKYAGLFELCKAYGVLEGDKTYNVPNTEEFGNMRGQKLGYAKSFQNDKDLWEHLLPILDKKLKSEFRYSSEKLQKEAEELTEELEEKVEEIQAPQFADVQGDTSAQMAIMAEGD